MLKRAVAALVPTAASAHLGMVDSSVAVKAGAEPASGESAVGCSAETFNGASCCTLLHATGKLSH